MSKLENLETAFRKIEDSASQKGVELDKSFYTELENYSLHRKVRRLGGAELTQVVESIGEIVIRERSGKLGGGHVRDILTRLCSDPFSDCFDAASRVIEVQHDIDRLMQDVAKDPAPGDRGSSEGT